MKEIKKICIFAYIIMDSLVILLLGSCSDAAEIGTQNHQEELKEISFNVYSDNNFDHNSYLTRAELLENDNLVMHNISLTAVFSSGEEYFKDEELAFSDEWRTTRKYYWPNESLSFFAHLPYEDEGIVKASENNNKFEYVLSDDCNKQNDLMYAVTNNISEGENVSLHMLHALAAVTFKVKKKDISVDGVISGIAIENLATTGTFYYPSGQTSGYNSSPICEWRDLANVKNVSASIFETELTPDVQLATDVGGELLIIPQSVNSRIIITCKLMDSGLYLAGSESSYGTVYVNFSQEFVAGCHYVYILEFGVGQDANGNKNELQITLGHTITDWGKETINFDKRLL